jgi:hypothetical protein
LAIVTEMLIANFWKYVSAVHGMHSALASSAYVTSRQMHVDTPAGEVLSEAQGAQVSSLVLSVACEYLPAAHCSIMPEAPYEPCGAGAHIE